MAPSTAGVQVTVARVDTFAYGSLRYDLTTAPDMVADSGEAFVPTKVRITDGRPGAPGRPDHGVEIEMSGPHPSTERLHGRVFRNWSTGGFGKHALSTAPNWARSLAGLPFSADTCSGQGVRARAILARLRSSTTNSGTEWRIELAGAPPTRGVGVGDFQPTVLLVLHSNIATDGGAFRIDVRLVGTRLPGHPLSGEGTGWASDALTPTRKLAAMPDWVRTLILTRTDLDLEPAAA